MKRMMMGMALAVFVAGAANAQDTQRKTKEDRAEMRTEQMAKELGLTEDQAKKVEEINARFREKMEAMHEQRKAEMETRTEKRDALQKEHAEALKAVLTPEQFAKWEARRAEMREKRMEHREGRPMKKQEGMHMEKRDGMKKQAD